MSCRKVPIICGIIPSSSLPTLVTAHSAGRMWTGKSKRTNTDLCWKLEQWRLIFACLAHNHTWHDMALHYLYIQTACNLQSQGERELAVHPRQRVGISGI